MLLFFCGDVMLGRAVDQILKHKNNPKIYESYYKDARCYIPNYMLNELNKIPKSDHDDKCYAYNITKPDEYIWGDLLNDKLYKQSQLRIINLETSITTSKHNQNKTVLYKMHPKNIGVIKVANVDYCCMANNHVLDWHEEGLNETIKTLDNNKIGYGGIGYNIHDARKPYIIKDKKVMIFSAASPCSGTFNDWRAENDKAGVNVVDIGDDKQVNDYIKYVKNTINDKYKNYMVIVSIHWGGNWGYEIPEEQTTFAHKLIDDVGVDVIHGHSSHHFKGMEVYKNKLIMYGCGDMMNDYETIKNHNHIKYMQDVNLAYYPSFDIKYNFVNITIVPYTIMRMRLVRIIDKERINEINKRIGEWCKNVEYGQWRIMQGTIILI